MNVLSLFDGMSCGRIALERAGIPVEKYYASEVDKYATQVSQANYPDIERLGDINDWYEWDIDWANIDLVIAGSPCQGFSFAGKQLAFDDPRSKLFFVFVEILKYIKTFNPDVKFMLENVRMKKESLDVITDALGVTPSLINSALASAQDRQRYYWSNWEVEPLKDKGLVPEDIIDKSDLSINPKGWLVWWAANKDFQLYKKYSHIMSRAHKAITMTSRQVASWNGNLVEHSEGVRFLSPLEAERLQTVPDGYTDCVSNTQRYKMIGNGWTVDVIAHIFQPLAWGDLL